MPLYDVRPKRITSLSDRGPASGYPEGFKVITTGAGFSIESTALGGEWHSTGSSDSIANRPSADLFGKGTWQVGSNLYKSDGVSYSILSIGENNICVLGDSTGWQNTTVSDISNPNQNAFYNPQGPVSMYQCYSGWQYGFEPSDNFAVGGTFIQDVIDSQIPLMLSAHVTRKYKKAFVSTGTNEPNTSTVAIMQTRLSTLFTTLREAGIVPIYVGIRPRGNDTTVTAQVEQKCRFMAINEWAYNLSLTGAIEYVDVNSAYAVVDSIYGNATIGSTQDYLHPNNTGAALEGQLIASAYANVDLPKLKFATSPLEIIDRTLNPFGTSINPTLLGTGTAPTGMTTAGGIWAPVVSTLPNGQSKNSWGVAAVVASTVHLLRFYITGDAGAGDTGQFAGNNRFIAGDVIELRAKVRIISGHALRAFLQVVETNGDASTLRTITCLESGLNASLVDGDHTLYLKTPRITIRPYFGSGNAQLQPSVRVVAAAGATGSFLIDSFEIRRVG